MQTHHREQRSDCLRRMNFMFVVHTLVNFSPRFHQHFLSLQFLLQFSFNVCSLSSFCLILLCQFLQVKFIHMSVSPCLASNFLFYFDWLLVSSVYFHFNPIFFHCLWFPPPSSYSVMSTFFNNLNVFTNIAKLVWPRSGPHNVLKHGSAQSQLQTQWWSCVGPCVDYLSQT